MTIKSLKNISQPLRLAITGTIIGPSIIDTLLLLGQKSTICHIQRCLALREEKTHLMGIESSLDEN